MKNQKEKSIKRKYVRKAPNVFTSDTEIFQKEITLANSPQIVQFQFVKAPGNKP